MTQSDLFEYTERAASPKSGAADGRLIGHAAAEVAADHADAVVHAWREAALSAANRFLASRAAPFVTSELVEFAEGKGVPPPPDRRAWGAIVLALARAGAIVKTGAFVESPQASQHGTPVRQWRKA